MPRLEEIDKELVRQTLELHNGDKQETALALGISLRTVYRAIQKPVPQIQHPMTDDLVVAQRRLDKAEGKKPHRISKQFSKRIRPKATAASVRKHEDEKIVTVSLGLRHSVNGVGYGPGRVTGPAKVVMPLVYAEQKAARSELKLHQPRGGIIQMGPGGPKLINVPVDRLDAFLG